MGRTKKKIIDKNISLLNLEQLDINNTPIINTSNTTNTTNTTNENNNNSDENNHIKNYSNNGLYETDLITVDDFKKKEKMLYDVLNNFFNQCTIDEIKMIIDIINGEHSISLRFLDWFVTRYCYLYKLSIPINNLYNKEQNFNINISYKAQLKSFKKRYFDPFRRKKKFNFLFNKHKLSILTTLGQLNFFRWILSYDIIKYTENNYDNINCKMTHVNSYFNKNIIELNSLTIGTSDNKTDITNNIDNSSVNYNLEKYQSDQSNQSNQLNQSNKNIKKIKNKQNNNLLKNKLSQNDIDILMNVHNQSHNHSQNQIDVCMSTYKKIQKPSKFFNDLKNSQPVHKYPQVSRNIFLEF